MEESNELGISMQWRKTNIDDLPDELAKPLRETVAMVGSYLAGLSFIVKNTGRDPRFQENHLLSFLSQDLLQSAISVITLGSEGLLAVAKREVRFIIEASIKLCFVQQQAYNSLIDEKLHKFDKELSSQRISIQKNIDLTMLPEDLHDAFVDEVGRLYGLTSKYVHLSPQQLNESIAALNAGRTAGKESSEDIENLNALLAPSLAASLTLLFHSVPEYVAGDWLVENDGSSTNWYFSGSKFIAGLDSKFDYKHERQKRLSEIQETRRNRICF